MSRRRIICICIACILLAVSFAGCERNGGDKGDTDQSKENAVLTEGSGRFVERETAVPDEIDQIAAVRMTENGSLEVIGRNQELKAYYLLTSGDMGESWNVTQIQGLTEDYYPRIAIAPDGTTVFVPFTSNGTVNLKIADIQGQTAEKPVTMPETGDSDNNVQQAGYDDLGNLLFLDMNGSLLKIDVDAGTYSTPFDTQGIGINYFGIAGTTCIAVYDNGCYVFHTETGQSMGTESALTELIRRNADLASTSSDSGYPMAFTQDGTDGLVFASEQGIFCQKSGGNVIEQLLDSSLTFMGTGNVVFYGVAMPDAENIFLGLSDKQGTKLLHYRYDRTAAAVPDQELTVYALDESNLLREAVAVFGQTHPDIYVNLQIGMSGEDSVTVEDALSVLNTDIMAKKGPDVLILDGMPLDSYIEKGILSDISDVVDEVEKEDGLFKNIRSASETEGHIYAMPVNFFIPMAAGDADTVKAAASLKTFAARARELGDANPSKPVMPADGTKGLLRELYYADSARWRQEDGSLNEDVLTDYLTAAKTLYDVDQYSADNDRTEIFGGDGTVDGTKVSSLKIDDLFMNEAQMTLGTMGGAGSYQLAKSAETLSKTSCAVLNSGEVSSYVPYLLTGVTADGNVDMAKEFVKVLLGKEVGADAEGIPVNRAAFAGQVEKTDQAVEIDSSIGIGSPDGGEFYGYEFVKLTESDIDVFTGWIESLEKPAMTDRVIQNLVLEQGEKYLLGEQDLTHTVQAIRQKVGLYLAE